MTIFGNYCCFCFQDFVAGNERHEHREADVSRLASLQRNRVRSLPWSRHTCHRLHQGARHFLSLPRIKTRQCSSTLVNVLQLKNAIVTEIRDMKLQAIPHTISKVIQLYESKNSRHSVMIVGDTLTSKTVCWRVLQAAMGRLNREGDDTYQPVRVSYPLLHLSLSPSRTQEYITLLFCVGLPSQPEGGFSRRVVRRVRSQHQRMDRRNPLHSHATHMRRSARDLIILVLMCMQIKLSVYIIMNMQMRSRTRRGWCSTVQLTHSGSRA